MKKMKYKTVVIDPPWPLTSNKPRTPDGNRSSIYTRAVNRPYNTTTLEEIQAFPIDDFADDDCILWLWVPNMNIRDAFAILEKWNFTYRSCLTWVKNRMGLGYWLRGKTEHCLLATRGCPEWNNTTMTTVINADIKGDSEKPARFYQLLRAWTPEPRIDIFARNAHEGFDGWGDEYVGEGPLAPYLKEKMKQ